MAGLLHRNWPIYRNAQKCQKYSFSNGRFGPKRKAAAGCLNREHAALNIWRESATSNFKKQPKTVVSPFRRRRALARKFIAFFYWLTINFFFLGATAISRGAARCTPFTAPSSHTGPSTSPQSRDSSFLTPPADSSHAIHSCQIAEKQKNRTLPAALVSACRELGLRRPGLRRPGLLRREAARVCVDGVC